MSNKFGLGMAGTNGRNVDAECRVNGGRTGGGMSREDEARAAEMAVSQKLAEDAAKVAVAHRMAVTVDAVESVVGVKAWSNRGKRMQLCKKLVDAGVFHCTGDAMEWFMTN